MDTKSKVLMATLFALILASAAFMFDKYVVMNDFEIYKNEDGVPLQIE